MSEPKLKTNFVLTKQISNFFYYFSAGFIIVFLISFIIDELPRVNRISDLNIDRWVRFASSIFLPASIWGGLTAIYLTISRFYTARKFARQLGGEVTFYKASDPETWQNSAISLVNAQKSLTESEKFLANKNIALIGLESRTGSISSRNTIILVFIAVILLLAVMIVAFAGSLASWDAASVTTPDRLQSELRDTEKKISDISEAIRLSKNIETLTAKVGEIRSLPSDNQLKNVALEGYRGLLNQLSAANSDLKELRLSSAGLPTDSATLASAAKFYVDKRESIARLQLTAWDKQIATERDGLDYRFLATTTITRIGVVLLIVFLVQIFLGFYKYNTRVNTYYNSVKDIIRMWSGDPKELKDLLSNLGPPKVDFGKDPKHPLEDIIKVVDDRIKANSQKSDPSQKSSSNG